MSAHGLCYCAACADMAAFLARAIECEETHRLTEAEIRLAALLRALVLQTLLVTLSPPWGES